MRPFNIVRLHSSFVHRFGVVLPKLSGPRNEAAKAGFQHSTGTGLNRWGGDLEGYKLPKTGAPGEIRTPDLQLRRLSE